MMALAVACTPAASSATAAVPTRAATPTATAVPAAVAAPDAALAAYPLAMGATWVYSVTFITTAPGADGEAAALEVRDTGLVTETVTDAQVQAARSLYTTTLTGTLTRTVGPPDGPGVLSRTAVPFAALRTYAAAGGEVLRDGRILLRTPLAVDASWPLFAGEDAGADAYAWRVDDRGPVESHAGTFADCFHLMLQTAPDHTLAWFCPGVGFVRYELRHHGPPDDQLWELWAVAAP